MIYATLKDGCLYATAPGIWQYDYGQVLRIQGMDLPTAVEIHFSLRETGGEAVTVSEEGVANAKTEIDRYVAEKEETLKGADGETPYIGENGNWFIDGTDTGKPTGAHDAYNAGDVVDYNGTLYVSLIDGNTYSPDVYPAGWNVYTAE